MDIVSEKIVFDKSLIIEEAQLKSGSNNFKRQRVNRQDASAVLLLNTDTNKIVLTKQFRYAISAKSKDYILEIVAGKIEEGHSADQTAIRETEEEVGYKINPENLKLLATCFPSPGYTSELFNIYFATATNKDKVTEGGGLEEENEAIEIVEVPAEKFKKMILDGEIKDGKTYIAGLFMIQQFPLPKGS